MSESYSAGFCNDPSEAIRSSLSKFRRMDLSAFGDVPEEGWSLAPDAMRFLCVLVQQLRPMHVIEFGTGLSTQALAWTREMAGLDFQVSSIDHDPEFGRLGEEELVERYRQSACAFRFQRVHLVARKYGAKVLPTYCLETDKLASSLPADLIVLDGPPEALGGREGVLYQSMAYARENSLVLIDDAKRKSEQAAIKNWKDNLEDAISVIELRGFSRGLAAVILRRPVLDLQSHILNLDRKDIERYVPAGHVIYVLGSGYWSLVRLFPEGRVQRFLSEEGSYCDDESATRELKRRRSSGLEFIAVRHCDFWWFDHYLNLTSYLHSNSHRILQNDRIVIFRMS